MAGERILILLDEAGRASVTSSTLRAAGFDVHEAPVTHLLNEARGYDLVLGPLEAVIEQVRSDALRPVRQIAQALVSDATLPALLMPLLSTVRREGAADLAWLIIEGETSLVEVDGNTSLKLRQLRDVADHLLRALPSAVQPAPVALQALRGAGLPDEHVLWLTDAGWDGLLLVPLVANGRRIGAVFAAGRREALRTTPAALHYLGFLADQAAVTIENIRLYHRARTQSLTDSMTGLPNARALRDILPTLVAQARRSGRSLSLILLDSDTSASSSGLKSVNDRFGHGAGDQLIVQLAQTIKSGEHGVRASDIVARYTGGDEFVVLMPDTDAAQARVVAERLRSAVDGQVFEVAGHRVRCTISLGVATYPTDATSPEDLLRGADVAMYEAKRRGKNCVVLYSELSPVERLPGSSIA